MIPLMVESSLSSGGRRPLCSTCRTPASRSAPATISRSAARAPGFDVLSAEVSFYNVANPGTILNSDALDPHVIVNGINLAGGHLSGIDTGFFDFFVSELTIAGSGQYSFSLILFGGKQAQLIFANPPQTSPGCVLFPVHGASCGSSANAATGVFALVSEVSEPETLALMLAGLGGIGLVARRRRR